MDSTFDLEHNRTFNSHDSKPDLAREYTISDLLHKIDPSASIDPVAENLLLDIADDFIDSIISIAKDSANLKEDKKITSEEIQFCIQRRFGETTGSTNKYGFKSQRGFIPSESHLKRLEAIEKAAQSNQ